MLRGLALFGELQIFFILHGHKGDFLELCFVGSTQRNVTSLIGGNVRAHVSVSHEREYAIANVVLETV